MAKGILTKRERQVFELLVTNKTTKEIADILNISEKTVRNHISNAMQKLEVKARTQAVIELIKLDQATRNGAAVVVGGGATPIIPMPQPGTLQNNNQNPQNTGGRTR